jgi:cysteine peptidase C11 family protein
MVYMAAGDSSDLDSVAVRELREMERGLLRQVAGSAKLKVVVQIKRHWPRSAQRYEILGSGARLLEQLEGTTNSGDGKTFEEFLTAVATNPDFHAASYCLVLWGHAYGLGFGRDHSNSLTLPEIQSALGAFAQERGRWSGGDGTLEILGANACAMSYLEAAYQLRSSAKLMLASQITVPFSGWPFETILARIRATTTPLQAATLIADAYVGQFNDLPGADKLAMTVLNLAAAEKMKTQLERLAVAIQEEIAGERATSAALAFFRDMFMSATAGDVRPLVDLVRLCTALADPDQPEGKPVQSNAEALLRTLNEGEPEARLIASHFCHPDLDDLNGLGIYVPSVADHGILRLLELEDPAEDGKPAGPGDKAAPGQTSGRTMYESLDLFAMTGRQKAAWPALVYDGLRAAIPRDLQVTIDGIAEMQSGDRADVAQIIMAIEASLNQFDRVVARAGKAIKSAFRLDPARQKLTPIFGRPALRLLSRPTPSAGSAPRPNAEMPKSGGAAPPPASPVIAAAVKHCQQLEQALGEVERSVKRGFTHARFGLGPWNASAIGLGLEHPKGGKGLEPPKGGKGLEPPKGGRGLPEELPAEPGGDLRSDLALARVAELFAEVATSLAAFEDALAHVEETARDLLDPKEGAAGLADAASEDELQHTLGLLQEASLTTRRTVRRALAHPVYGLGPGEGELSAALRDELAMRGGLTKARLTLL